MALGHLEEPPAIREGLHQRCLLGAVALVAGSACQDGARHTCDAIRRNNGWPRHNRRGNYGATIWMRTRSLTLIVGRQATAYRNAFDVPGDLGDNESEAASDRQAAIIDPVRERILGSQSPSIVDLAILAAHECTPEPDGTWYTAENGPGTRALIEAVLELAGIASATRLRKPKNKALQTR